METQQQEQDLKAERVQEEIAAAVSSLVEEPFQISLKAERVQAPVSVRSGPVSAEPAATGVSLAYEMSFHPVKAVTIRLEEPQIVIDLFATTGLAAA